MSAVRARPSHGTDSPCSEPAPADARAAIGSAGGRRCIKNENNAIPRLGGLIVLIADVWAIVNIFQSGAEHRQTRCCGRCIVILLPIARFILWYFFGPRTGRASVHQRRITRPQARRWRAGPEQHRGLVAAVAQRGVDRGAAVVRARLRDSDAVRCHRARWNTVVSSAFADSPHGPSGRCPASARTITLRSSKPQIVGERGQLALAALDRRHRVAGSRSRASARTSSRAPFKTRSSRSSHSIHDSELACIIPARSCAGCRVTVQRRADKRYYFNAQSTSVGAAHRHCRRASRKAAVDREATSE